MPGDDAVQRKMGPIGAVMLMLCAAGGWARTRNGNDLALDFASADDGEKARVSESAVGNVYFFRYLRIVDVEAGVTNRLPYVRMSTVEPASDMYVDFVVRKTESLKKVEPLGIDDGIAVLGRVTSIGERFNAIVLDPVIVRYRDRLQPKTGKELLHEVDPDARRGTDTSTGEIKVIR